ncbi:MAG: ABC transporter substrate-binding protein [bacterium]
MRRFGLLSIVLALSLMAAGPAAAEKLRLHTDWVMAVSGDIPPFFLGVERGYYKAEGIDLEILGGTGSGNAVKVIAAGTYELGFADFGSLIMGRLHGARVKAVMGLLQQGGGSFIYLKKSGIRTMKDLKGRSIAMSPGGSEDASVRAVMALNGLKMSDVKWQYMPGMGKIFAVIGGKADAVGTLWNKMVPFMESKGQKVGYLAFADYGVNLLHKGIFVNTGYLAKNKGVIRRFVRANQRAWLAATWDPEAAIDAFLRRFPKKKKDKPVFMKVLSHSLGMTHTPNNQGKPFGWMSAKDWESSQSVLVKYTPKLGGKSLPVSEFFTNEFVPK